MNEHSNPFSFKQLTKFTTLLLASLALLDMILPGQSFESIIEKITIRYEPYFNAVGNGHDSYAIVTEKHSFYIDEEAKEEISEGQEIQYRLSPLFKEIQHYQTEYTLGKTSSIRLFSGVFLPIFCILVIVLSFRFKERLSIITFVCQVATLANLIYLLN